ARLVGQKRHERTVGRGTGRKRAVDIKQLLHGGAAPGSPGRARSAGRSPRERGGSATAREPSAAQKQTECESAKVHGNGVAGALARMVGYLPSNPPAEASALGQVRRRFSAVKRATAGPAALARKCAVPPAARTSGG